MVFAGVSEVQVEEESVGQGLELPLGSCLGGSRRGAHAHRRGPAGPQPPRGDRARGRGEGWALAGGGGLRGSCSVGPLPLNPYVLLKDTAMVSTAFSNSRLSVSLLDS